MRLQHQYSPDLPVLDSCDVLVVGGGPSGCAAAVTAARTGVDTLLLEQGGCLGGATVQQNVVLVLSQNAVDFQGIWHEYMAQLLKMGGAYEKEFHFRIPFINGTVDPVIVQYVWDRLLTSARARFLYHCTVVDTLHSGDAVTGVVVQTPAGLARVNASRVIDCTGDGVVANAAGVPWDSGTAGSPYAMSLTKVVRLGGVARDAGLPQITDKSVLRHILAEAVRRGEFHSPLLTSGRVINYIGTTLNWRLPHHRDEIMLVTSRILYADPLSPTDLTRAEKEGMWDMWEVADFYRRYVPGCENCFLADISNHVGVRSSRRIRGRDTVTDEDVLAFRKRPDGIARASWQPDVWPADSYTAPAGTAGGIQDEAVRKVYAAHIMKGDYFDVPYGSLVPTGVEGLLTAGRILSASHLAESSLRIQQTCMATGEAAGLAASMSIRAGVMPSALDGTKVAAALEMRRRLVPCAMRGITEILARQSR